MINYSSIVAIKELAPPLVIDGVVASLIALVDDGRLFTVSLAWAAINDDDLYEALEPCRKELVVREKDLFGDIDIVYAACGTTILGNDPTLESPDPWLLALAERNYGAVVTEPNVLSSLAAGCQRMGIRVLTLVELLDAEGVPH